MRRREFIAGLAGAAAWTVAATIPTVGFLNSAPPDAFPDRLRAFHRGLEMSNGFLHTGELDLNAGRVRAFR